MTETRLATVGGATLAWDLSGPEGATAVVLSHSLASDRRMWDPQTPALSERYRVLRIDMRGHGGSAAAQGPYTFEMLAADVVGVMDAAGLAKAHFVGLSIGGMIGQYLGLLHAGRFESLALCSTTSRIPPEAGPMWDERMDAVRTQGMETQVAPTLDRWFTPEFATREPGTMDWIAGMIRNTSTEGFLGCAAAIRDLDLTARLGEIGLPTLVMPGELDPGTPVAASEAIAGAIPGARLRVLPGVRHLSNVQTPDAFTENLVEFLA